MISSTNTLEQTLDEQTLSSSIQIDRAKSREIHIWITLQYEFHNMNILHSNGLKSTIVDTAIVSKAVNAPSILPANLQTLVGSLTVNSTCREFKMKSRSM